MAFKVRDDKLLELTNKKMSVATVILVIPTACEKLASSWLQSQPNVAVVTCCSHPEQHGNAGKKIQLCKK